MLLIIYLNGTIHKVEGVGIIVPHLMMMMMDFYHPIVKIFSVEKIPPLLISDFNFRSAGNKDQSNG